MRELFQVLDREDRISILKLLSLLIKESNKTTYNDNSDWILAFNEAGFRTDALILMKYCLMLIWMFITFH